MEYVGKDAFIGTPWYNEFFNSQPDGLIYLGKACYKYKGTLPDNANIVVDEGTLYLTDHLFSDSVKLASITLPESLKGVGDYAFQNCKNLVSVSLPSNFTTFGVGAFKNCISIPSIVIPEGVTEINEEVFSGCSQLAEVSFPKSLLTIGVRAFENCTSLMHVDFPKRLTTIKQSAFSFCGNDGIKVVKIPSSVETIEYRAFNGFMSNGHCDHVCGLDTIYFKSRWCKGLTSFEENNSNYPLQADRNPLVMYQGHGDGHVQYAGSYGYFNHCNYTDSANYVKPADIVLCSQGQGYLSIEMYNVEKIVGFQFDLKLPEGVTIATVDGKYSATLSNRKGDHSLSVEKIDENSYRFISVSMNNQPFSDNEGEILRLKVLVDANMNLGEYNAVVIEAELTSYDEDYDLVEQIVSMDSRGLLTIQEHMLGDVNGDGEMNVTDIVEMVNYILNRPTNSFIFTSADVNGDYKVSVTDIVLVVSMIMDEDVSGARRAEPAEAMPTDNDELTLEAKDGCLSMELTNAGEYVAAQFDVQLGDGQQIENVVLNRLRENGHRVTFSRMGITNPCQQNVWRVLVYSLDNETFLRNDGELLSIHVSGDSKFPSTTVSIDNILFITDRFAEKNFAPINYQPTGIDDVKRMRTST